MEARIRDAQARALQALERLPPRDREAQRFLEALVEAQSTRVK